MKMERDGVVLFEVNPSSGAIITENGQPYSGGGGSGVQHRQFDLLADAVGVTVTNAASAGTEPANGITRLKADLSGFADARVLFVSSLNSILVSVTIQSSTDQVTWADVCASPAVAVANGLSVGSWAAIPAGAKADVFLRALVKGNGVLDPIVRKIALQVK